ncbi:MAG TPA: thiolase family protein [Dehalococcoidia bacterium]|nr:thiolase family protein [Dehalococcoidia bacterium]
MSLRGQAAIVGIGELKPERNSGGKTALELLAEVGRRAISDAGLGKSDIDGLLTGASFGDISLMWPSTVAEYVGLRPSYAECVDLGGASPAGMVWRAAAAIAAGQCTTALCLTADALDPARFYAVRVPMPSIELEFEHPYGPMGANSGYALAARRHMSLYGTTSDQLAKIAVDQRTNACANPGAIFYGKPLTIEDVLNSPLIVDPLHLLEIVMPCAGGSAVVVTSADRARDLPHKPVYLLGAGEKVTHAGAITHMPDYTVTPIKDTAAKAFAMAGLGPGDMDLVSVYDCYTITVLLTLEDAGFCAKGEGGPFVMSTDLTYRGQLPVNTHGGQLSFGQAGLAGGMSHVTEAARQLMGRAGDRQLARCEAAFVNGNGGILSEQCSLVLGTSR